MPDTATVTGYGYKYEAHAQALRSAQPYLNQGYVITNEVFIPEPGMSGCLFALILIILFVSIIGLLFLPLLLLRPKKGTYTITLTHF